MEILLIIAIILGILLLPRMMRRPPSAENSTSGRAPKLSGWNRLAILASFLWLTFFALYLRPWNHEWLIYVYAGVSPVVLYWGIYWTYLGFRKKNI